MLLFDNIKNTVIAIIVIIAFGGGMYFWGTKSINETIPDPIVVTIPGKDGVTDTLWLDQPVPFPVPGETRTVVDSTYYFKYLDEKDEKEKLKLFVDAITLRDTTVALVDDDRISLTVTSKVRGKLLSQFAHYTIKPFDTVIQPPSYHMPKYKLYIGAHVRVPSFPSELDTSFGGHLMIQGTKRENFLTIGYDTQRYVSIGYSFRIFKGNNK